MIETAIVKIENRTLPEKWDYDESVKKQRTLRHRLNRMSNEMVHEFWVARENLSASGRPKLSGNIFPLKTWNGYCEETGFTKRAVNMLLAKYDPDTKTIAHVGHNSGDNEWYTPSGIIDSAAYVLGGIDLDPASTETANEIIQAKKFYSLDDSGLDNIWSGRVWMNPPYSQPEIGEFTDKLVKHYFNGDITSAIVLTNNATETQWYQVLARECNAICLISSRIKFWAPDKSSASPLQGQILTYFGPGWREFKKEFNKHGEVFRK